IFIEETHASILSPLYVFFPRQVIMKYFRPNLPNPVRNSRFTLACERAVFEVLFGIHVRYWIISREARDEIQAHGRNNRHGHHQHDTPSPDGALSWSGLIWAVGHDRRAQFYPGAGNSSAKSINRFLPK